MFCKLFICAGNHGTLSYSLGSTRLVLNVMWTSGMNCDHYANTLAIGVTSSPNTDKFKSVEQCRLLSLIYYDFSIVQCSSSGSPGLRSRTSCSIRTRWCLKRTGQGWIFVERIDDKQALYLFSALNVFLLSTINPIQFHHIDSCDRFLVTASMLIRPQTDVIITVEELEEK